MNRIICVFFLFLFAASGCKPTSDEKAESVAYLITDSVKNRIDATLKNLVDSGRIAGVSALIFEKNKEVYFNAFGYADKEAGVPMDRNTIVRIWSMTKPIT